MTKAQDDHGSAPSAPGRREDGPTQPIVLGADVDAATAHWQLQVPQDLRFCEGHFEAKAIVPGVVQIGWVLQFAQQAFGLARPVCRMEAVKFRSLLCPGQVFDLILRWDDSSRKLHYSLERPGQPIASGRLVMN